AGAAEDKAMKQGKFTFRKRKAAAQEAPGLASEEMGSKTQESAADVPADNVKAASKNRKKASKRELAGAGVANAALLSFGDDE
ncbi:hypothetical protein CYMTET_13496, partial [Cymbomonas tetramitiformis]